MNRSISNRPVIDSVRIVNESVGRAYPCYVIAEIGNKRNGHPDLAKRLIGIAADGGAAASPNARLTFGSGCA